MRVVLGFLFFSLGLSAQALASDSIETISVSNLKFDKPSSASQEVPLSSGLGALASIKTGISGFGLTYEKPVAERIMFWAQASYGESLTLMDPAFASSSRNTDYVFLDQKDRVSLQAGVDRYVFLNRRHTWAVFGGLGAGLARSQVKAKSYPEICRFWCGFDQSKPFQDSAIDLAALASLRIGLKIRNIRAIAGRMDFALAIVNKPLRWPKYVELDTVESGRQQVNPDYSGYLQAETTFRF